MSEPFWLSLSDIEYHALRRAEIYGLIGEHLAFDDGSCAEFQNIDEMAKYFYEQVTAGTDVLYDELVDMLQDLYYQDKER